MMKIRAIILLTLSLKLFSFGHVGEGIHEHKKVSSPEHAEEALSSDILMERVSALKYLVRRNKKVSYDVLIDSLDLEKEGGFIDDVYHSPLREGILYWFARKFPEYGYVPPGSRGAPFPWRDDEYEEKFLPWRLSEIKKDAAKLQSWWEINRDKIEFNSDGTHSWLEEPISVDSLSREKSEDRLLGRRRHKDPRAFGKTSSHGEYSNRTAPTEENFSLLKWLYWALVALIVWGIVVLVLKSRKSSF